MSGIVEMYAHLARMSADQFVPYLNVHKHAKGARTRSAMPYLVIRGALGLIGLPP
jgi:hypothetical protein